MRTQFGQISTLHDIIERKRMEAALRESEERYRQVFENLPDALFLLEVTEDGRFRNLALNPAFERAVGIPAERLIGRYVDETVDADTAQHMIAKYRQCVESGTIGEYEAELTLPVGRRWFRSTLIPVRDETGRVARIVGLTRDITARKGMENALQASEEKFRTVFESANDGIFLRRIVERGEDTEFILVDLNQKGCELWGYSREDILSGNVELLTLGDPPYTFEEATRRLRLAAAGQPQVFDWQLTRKDGSKAWGEVNLRRIRIGDEDFVLSVMRDISERKAMEEALYARQEEFRALAENLPDTVVRYDCAGKRTYVNPAFKALTNIPMSDLIGKPPTEAFIGSPAFGQHIQETVERVLRTGVPTEIEITNDTVGRMFEGPVKYGHIRYVPEFGPDGSLTGVLSIGRDITTLRETELSLRKLAESSPSMMGTYLLRPDGTVCMPYASPRIWDIYGVRPEDVVQDASAATDRIHPDDVDGVMASTAESARTLMPWRHEFRVIHPERGEVWAEGHFTPRRQPDGSTIWYGFVYDITDRKQAEETIRRNEARLAEAASIAQLGYWEFDVSTEAFTVTDQFYALLRTTAEEQGGYQIPARQYIQQFGHPDDAYMAGVETQKANEATDPNYIGQFEHRVIRADGSEGVNLVRFRVIKDEQGRPVKSVGINQDITERKRMEAALAKRADELQTVAWVSTAITTILNTDELLQDVVYLTTGSFNVYHARIYLYDEQGKTLNLAAETGDAGPTLAAEDRRIPLDREQSLVARAARSWQGRTVNNTRTASGFLPTPLLSETRSELAVPLVAGDQVLGVFDVQSDQVNYFSEEDINIQTILAAQIAVALQNARFFTQSEERAEELAFINRIVTEINALDIKTGLQFMAEEIGKILQIPFITIGLINDAGTIIEMVAAHYPAGVPSLVGTVFPTAEDPVISPVLQNRQTFIVEDVANSDLPPQAREMILKLGARSVYVIPMLIGRDLIGTVSLGTMEGGSLLSPEQLKLAETTVYHVSTVVQNARLFTQSKERQTLLRTIIDATPDWIFMKDQEDRYRMVNQSYADVLHLAPEDFIGKNDLELGFPEKLVKGDPEKGIRGFWADDRLVMDSGEMHVYPDNPATIDGEVHTLHTIKTPLRDTEGQVWGVLAFARDITELKQTEETLRQSEARLVEAADIAQLGHWEFIHEAQILIFTDRFYALLGTTAEEQGGYQMTTQDFTQKFVHPDDKQMVGREIRKAIERDDLDYVSQFEHRITRADGSERYLVVRFRLIRDKHNRKVKTIGISQDITERKQVEEMLRRSQEQLSGALETAKLANWEFDVATQMFTFNDRFYALYRTTAEQEGGYLMPASQYAQKFVHPEDAHKVGIAIRQTIETTDPNKIFQIESRNIRGDGSQGHILVKFRVVQDEQGRTIGTIGATQDITERKQAEETIRRNEARLSEAADIAQLGYWEFDVSTQMFTFTDQFYTLLRTSAEEQGGYQMSVAQYVQKFTYPNDVSSMDLVIQQAMGTTDPNFIGQAEHRIIRADDSEGVVAVRFRVIKDKQGQTVKTAGTNQDITKRKQAEEIIRQNETRLAEAADMAQLGYWEFDYQTQVFTVTDQLWAIFRTTAEEQGGYQMPAAQFVQKFVHPDDVYRTAAEVRKRTESTEPGGQIEYHIIRADGSEGVNLARYRVIKDEQGRPVKAIGVCQDITERRQVEDAVLKAKVEWERTFDAVPDLIAILDPEHRIVRVNQALAEKLARTPDACAGLHCYTLMHTPLPLCSHQQVLCNRQTHTTEVFDERLGGHLLVTTSPLFDPQGNVFGSVHIARDINTQKQTEEQLQRTAEAAEAASRAKSEFLANMSHEIRTPMNALLGFTEILEGKITDPQLQYYASLIHASGKTLLHLLNDILDLSKIEAGKLELRYAPVNLRLVCQEVAQIFAQRISEKGLDFVLEVDPELPEYLLFDEIRLRQILLNLVGNAVKFTDQGSVTLKIEDCQLKIENWKKVDTPDQSSIVNLQLSIIDTGIGIPEDQRETIFGAFEQARGHSPAYGGTGLGLAISKRLLEMMGGTIAVTGAVGQGSVFTIRFPHVRRAEGPDPETPRSAISVDTIRFDPAIILIVDDVLDNRVLLRHYLEDFGFATLDAATGEDAVDLARRARPDLILMDIRMPGMNGVDATRIIKRSADVRDIPVIAVTGAAVKESVANILAVCDGYLSKPVEKTALLAELIKFLPHTFAPGRAVQETQDQPAADDRYDLAALSPEAMQQLPEARQLLETVWLPRWKTFRAALIINDVNRFTVELAQFAREYRLQIIQNYAERLSHAAQMYDISGVKKRLVEFPGLVEQLTDITE